MRLGNDLTICRIQNAAAADPGPLVLKIDTTNTEGGSTASDTFKLALQNVGTYNFDIDWGDDTTSTITAYNDANLTHTYSTGGEYIVKVNINDGTFGGANGGTLRVNNLASNDRLKYVEVQQWGEYMTWYEISQAFYGCSNMDITATDSLIMYGTTASNNSMGYAFAGCSSLTILPKIDWTNQRGSIADASYMFSNCTSLTDISEFNSRVQGYTPSGSVNCIGLFYNSGIVTLPSSFDTTNLGGIGFWCYNCSNLETVEALDFSSGTVNTNINCAAAYQNCTSLTSYQITDHTGIDQSMSSFFYNCTSLTYSSFAGTLTLGATTNINSMFRNTGLEQIPLASLPAGVTNLRSTFRDCSSLNVLPSFSTSNITNFESAFQNCTSANSLAWDTLDWSAMTNGTNCFNGVTIDTSVYDDLLVELDTNNANTGVTFHGGNSLYTKSPSAAETARSNLLARVPAWSITDGGPTP